MDFGPSFVSLKSQELVPSGIPSLDAIIGGGLPVGSLILLNEDDLGIYSEMFFKTFLAQGVVNKDDIFLASIDVSPKKLISKLPQEASSNSIQAKISSNDPLQIAWRYENNPGINFPLDNPNRSYSSSFHFKNTLSDEIINSTNIEYWPSKDSSISYDDLIACIHKKIITNDHMKEQASKKLNKNVLRIGINHLGSFFWDEHQDRLPSFLYRLRALLHYSQAIALITFPKFLIQEPAIISRCEQMCDSVMELESFDPEANPLYSEFNGFITFNRLCNLNSLCPLMKDAKDWAFKLHHKKIIIEKLRLPPESAASVQREQDISTKQSCGQTNKLDF